MLLHIGHQQHCRMIRFLPTMTVADRDQMLELCRRIHRETDPKRLALWITDLNDLIQGKVDELKKQQPASSVDSR